MPARAAPPDPIETFLARWAGTEQAERANYTSFLNELCTILGVTSPDPARGSTGDYHYECSVTHHADDGGPTTRRIDLYRRDRFILEAKQGENVDRQTSLFGQTETQRRARPECRLAGAGRKRNGRFGQLARRGRHSLAHDLVAAFNLTRTFKQVSCQQQVPRPPCRMDDARQRRRDSWHPVPVPSGAARRGDAPRRAHSAPRPT